MRAVLFALALCVSACASTPGADDASSPFTASQQTNAAANYDISVDLPAGVYRLDPRHASVLFRIRHMDLAWFTARFDSFDASLTLDPQDPSRSQFSASLDPASINTGVLNEAGERAFDRQIARAIGVEASPRVTFAATSIERTGEFTARITGDLTMNGQTHPLALDATFRGGVVDPLRGGAMVLGFSAHGVIERSQWGVTSWRAFTSDEVQIVIEAELVRS